MRSACCWATCSPRPAQPRVRGAGHGERFRQFAQGGLTAGLLLVHGFVPQPRHLCHSASNAFRLRARAQTARPPARGLRPSTASTASSNKSKAARRGCCGRSSRTSSPGCPPSGPTATSSPQSAAQPCRSCSAMWTTSGTCERTRPYRPMAKPGVSRADLTSSGRAIPPAWRHIAPEPPRLPGVTSRFKQHLLPGRAGPCAAAQGR